MITAAYSAHARLAILLRLLEPAEDDRRRLYLLRLLAVLPGAAATVSLLHQVAADYHPPPSRDLVATDLAWLVEQRLATARGEIPGAALTSRGLDVAAGRATVPGVAPIPTLPWVHDGLHAVQLRLSGDDLARELGWLDGQGLVRLVEGAVWLTARGLEVARGRAEVAGVCSPSPETALRLAARLAAGGFGGAG